MNVSELRNKIHQVYKEESIYMELSLQNRLIKSGLGFFPYGSGLLMENTSELPQNGLMIVGQDFGNINYLKSKILEVGEANKPTFKKTVELINGFPNEKVFLTNLFMGLRNGKSKMIGVNPALNNNEKAYLNASTQFFELQLKYLKPQKIIVLGKAPYNFICSEFGEKAHMVVTFKRYLLEQVPKQFHQLNAPVLCIPHPSMWNSNVKTPNQWRQIINKFLLFG